MTAGIPTIAIGAFSGIVYRYSHEDISQTWIDKTPTVLMIIYKLGIFLYLSLPAAVIALITFIFPTLFDNILLMLFQIAIPAYIETFLLFSGLQQSTYRKIGNVELDNS